MISVEERRVRVQAWMAQPRNAGRFLIVKSLLDDRWVVARVVGRPERFDTWELAVEHATAWAARIRGRVS